ncbi:sigma-70 family RNA polymerase sigma factor [Phaeacidiphilus oryzae]|uniref:sigma-70 family RNA polymerase sigma factor n=1 Tax=Phaeacidiphilus oryzae TaxID=348818 RepID=UPI000691BC71|nr:sigma-70 family RNA polymerase sigma factor [Phaeacidiphilus oryzae]
MEQSAGRGPNGQAFLCALYAQHGRVLLGYVRRRVGGDHQRAEDIVQETFLRAWQHRDSLDTERAGPWLHTVAHNLIVSSYRRASARPTETPLGEEEPGGAPGRPVVDGDEQLDRMLEAWQLSEALRGLRPEHREALIHVYYLRRTVAETAEELGIPPGTVKSRCYYGLRALRNVLEEKGVTSR